jgi:hypothetical protein
MVMFGGLAVKVPIAGFDGGGGGPVTVKVSPAIVPRDVEIVTRRSPGWAVRPMMRSKLRDVPTVTADGRAIASRAVARCPATAAPLLVTAMFATLTPVPLTATIVAPAIKFVPVTVS